MLPVETLTFTKEQRTLPCKIVRMQQDDLDTEKLTPSTFRMTGCCPFSPRTGRNPSFIGRQQTFLHFLGRGILFTSAFMAYAIYNLILADCAVDVKKNNWHMLFIISSAIPP